MHRECQLTTNDGLNLYTQAWLSETPAKALVVIAHGLGEHSGRYAHVAHAFTENSIHAYSFDQRGHGKSEGPRGHIPTYQQLMDDFSLTLSQASKVTSEDLPVFLYGHSLGALEVIFYGLKNENNVRGTIATGLPLDLISTNKIKILFAKMVNPLIPKLTLTNGLDVYTLSRDLDVVKAYMDDPLVHDKASIRLGMFLLEGAEQILKDAPSWNRPLLLMHGSEDKICGIDATERFAQTISGEITFKRWEGLFHEIHNEPEKDEVIQTMVDWIENQL